MSENKLCPKFM